MKRTDLNRFLADELAHLPRGDYQQNVLRAVYNMQRRHDLALNPLTPRAVSLQESVKLVRKEAPAFVPEFDATYFGI